MAEFSKYQPISKPGKDYQGQKKWQRLKMYPVLLMTKLLTEFDTYVVVGLLSHCANYISAAIALIYGADFVFRMKSTPTIVLTV